MATRRRITSSSTPRRFTRSPYELPEDARRELLALLQKGKRPDLSERFLRRLASTIAVHGNPKDHPEADPPASAVRKELLKLRAALESIRSQLESEVRLLNGNTGSAYEIISDPLRESLCDRFAIATLPAFERWFQDVLREGRWTRRLPKESRYLLIFELALKDISECIRGACGPIAGGAPRATAKLRFVEQIVRDYHWTFGVSPSTTKEGPFERLVAIALKLAGYRAGDANTVLYKAARTVRAEKPPKIPPEN